MKRFLQKIFHKNPLSYLGWLGFIGVVGFLFSILCLAILVPRAIYYQFPQPQVANGMVQLSEQSYLQSLFCSAAFVCLFILMLAVFSISLLVFRHREKRALRETGA